MIRRGRRIALAAPRTGMLPLACALVAPAGVLLALVVSAGPSWAAPAKPDTSSCITCHRDADEARLRKPVAAWAADVHATAGLGCESCHRGDPSRAASQDPDEAADHAMDPAKGFKTPPDRLEVAQFCARCHSDAAYMKRYNPQLRVDQLTEYRTSVHGRLNAKGDETPATCIDCHGVHGIRRVNHPNSPVYATNVPKTCAHCHADSVKMAPYKIPTNQYADYTRSVHATALLEQGDVSAPACNDCHGNHGAAPPEVKSVIHVCGHCHAREATLYDGSSKKALFERLKVPECVVCHSNHRIRHATPELFHSRSGPEVSAGTITGRDPFAADFGDLDPGRNVEAAWRVVLSPHIEAADPRLLHSVEITADAMKPLVLDATVRPGAQALPPPARAESPSGLSALLSVEPLSGLPVEPGDALLYRLELAAGDAEAVRGVRVRDLPGKSVDPLVGSACFTCHKLGDSCDVAAERMYASLSRLDREIRYASSLLRKAELAGMEVSGPTFELKSKGTTARVEARALIHSFDADRLLKRATEGRGAADAAKRAGIGALDEIQFRRKGLAVSLVLIVGVLVGLYLKIRALDRVRGGGS
ncbi:MAG: cytochrome c3 family protein [Candidatus Latescibacteria bacterium]|nr:cytochrome c3 family protein [Candidatus Latescibacterota bacterium]